jgi:hypothetical protein
MKRILVIVVVLCASYVHAESASIDTMHAKHEVAAKYYKCLVKNFINPSSNESAACIKEIDKFILLAINGNGAVYEQLVECVSRTPVHQRSAGFNEVFRQKLDTATRLAVLKKN